MRVGGATSNNPKGIGKLIPAVPPTLCPLVFELPVVEVSVSDTDLPDPFSSPTVRFASECKRSLI